MLLLVVLLTILGSMEDFRIPVEGFDENVTGNIYIHIVLYRPIIPWLP